MPTYSIGGDVQVQILADIGVQVHQEVGVGAESSADLENGVDLREVYWAGEIFQLKNGVQVMPRHGPAADADRRLAAPVQCVREFGQKAVRERLDRILGRSVGWVEPLRETQHATEPRVVGSRSSTQPTKLGAFGVGP